MVLTFPLPLETFFNGLAIQFGTADLGEAVETSETGAGEILSAAIGNRLWMLDIEIATRDYREGERIRALLNTLRYPGRSLLCRPSPLRGPAADPKGTLLGSYVPTIISVATNNREINLQLPSMYVLTAGDFLSFTYSANPTRYALHQVAVGGQADGDGKLTVEVSSFVMPGWSVGAAVKLIDPVFKATVTPGSTKSGKAGQTRIDGISFSVEQTFR